MASRLARALAYLAAPANAVAFGVRRRLRWSRGVPLLANEAKDGLYAGLPPAERAAAEERELVLRARYDLGPLAVASTRLVYRENVALLDALERLLQPLPAPGEGALRVVDVGARNWSYVFGLDRFWRHWKASEGAGRPVSLTGIEVDGFGVYPDLRSRFDHARAFAAQTGSAGVRYEVADFLELEASGVDVVTLFYPFVTRYALLRWGLPLSLYAPEPLLAKAVSSLRPGGLLLTFCQTAEERDAWRARLPGAGATLVSEAPLASPLSLRPEAAADRWGLVAVRGSRAAPGAPRAEGRGMLHPGPPKEGSPCPRRAR